MINPQFGGFPRRGPRRRRATQCVVSALVPLSAWVAAPGCARSPWDVTEFLQGHEYAASGGDVKVMPGDLIAVDSPYVLEVDGITEAVGADGKINLDLVGDVHVAGLTAKEITRKLELQLEPYYSEPRLRVRVSGRTHDKIYVFGQVQAQGPRPYTGRDTVFDVLMESQPTFLAWKSEIKVIRASPDPNERRVIKVDFDRMVQQGDMRLNMLLQQGDIIYVPPTILGWLGLRVQEVLFPLSPVISAYQLPASVKATTEEYQDDDDDGDQRNRFSRRGLLLRR